ncbi:CYFIP-related Rac1 interactor B [Drosophila innubila]|uniref:CYFIP-related Rac1 interactor B n=1 Tax=Drosophila innubila TaxID=198719 RepID=UPI00148C8FDB|nr:CYFIP-related Rac1 interactor B [Drosophila innubila]XP_034483645.1 CYFIP-related Rac1 interactor B [Drosophila innubila]XP_034483646.1 CYFIP-related Rac1 interactor B [Drosophila innubila]
MGKLLSLLSRDDSNCCAAKSYDVFLDFENAAPTDTEREVYDEVERVLKESEIVLDEIQIYKGANKEIREAIADPSPEVQAKAWSAVLPLVMKLRRCYEHSLELDKIVPKLLGQLVGGKLNPTQHLETQQALVKQLAEILEFVLKFDEYKMKTPAIQNDFSYYRRIVSRQRVDSTENMLVSTELANRMSLFYAHATPMLKVLSEATSKFVNDNADDVQNTTETLGTMAKVCLRMLENPKLLQQIEREETQMLVLRVMVGLVILYDHVHPVGAFARGAHVDVKGCVRLLQAQPAIKAEPLLNALRYTTKHLNEENTPKNIRNMLAA